MLAAVGITGFERRLDLLEDEPGTSQRVDVVLQLVRAHRPFAEDECQVMIFEPAGVVNTGETGGDLTAENDVWI